MNFHLWEDISQHLDAVAIMLLLAQATDILYYSKLFRTRADTFLSFRTSYLAKSRSQRFDQNRRAPPSGRSPPRTRKQASVFYYHSLPKAPYPIDSMCRTSALPHDNLGSAKKKTYFFLTSTVCVGNGMPIFFLAYAL
jgi:hypothetical protein